MPRHCRPMPTPRRPRRVPVPWPVPLLLLELLLLPLPRPAAAEHVENTTSLVVNPTLAVGSDGAREGWRQEATGVLCQTLQVGAGKALIPGETYVLVASRMSAASGTIEVHDGDACVVNGGPPLDYADCSTGSPCSMCQGDCEIDLDCAVNLKCVQRDASEQVYGCTGGGTGDVAGRNYCARSLRVSSISSDGRFQAPYVDTASSVSIALRSASSGVWARVDLFKVLCTPDLGFTKALPVLACELILPSLSVQ